MNNITGARFMSPFNLSSRDCGGCGAWVVVESGAEEVGLEGVECDSTAAVKAGATEPE
jgi:hypothetical protein